MNRLVDLVVYPETEEDAQFIIAEALAHDVCIVPYGGGTNVTSTLLLPENEKRMVISLDTSRLNKVEWINEENQTACTQADIQGLALEDQFNAKGYMLGYQPDSIEFSTLGGWISTNASEMKKNKYSNIEDIVETVLITPDGVLEQREGMYRTSMGIKVQDCLFGSEGNLGLITKAVVKIHKKPELTEYASLVFKGFDTDMAFIKEFSKSNFIPASIRLVDNFQLGFGQVFKQDPTGFKKFLAELLASFLKNIKGLILSICIYFMFVIYTEGIPQQEDAFSDLEHKIRATIIEDGGSISHHHGVGKLRKVEM